MRPFSFTRFSILSYIRLNCELYNSLHCVLQFFLSVSCVVRCSHNAQCTFWFNLFYNFIPTTTSTTTANDEWRRIWEWEKHTHTITKHFKHFKHFYFCCSILRKNVNVATIDLCMYHIILAYFLIFLMNLLTVELLITSDLSLI